MSFKAPPVRVWPMTCKRPGMPISLKPRIAEPKGRGRGLTYEAVFGKTASRATFDRRVPAAREIVRHWVLG